MHDITKLSEKVEELRSEILALTEIPEGEATPEQVERFDPAMAEFEAAQAELAVAEERAAKVAAIRDMQIRKPEAVKVERSAPEVIVKRDAFEVLENRGAGMSPVEYRKALIDGNLRAQENKLPSREAEVHFEGLLRKHSTDKDFAEWADDLLRRARPEYATGFLKSITGRGHELTQEERTALSTLTNANGKYAVPTHLDASVIVTNDGSSNAIRPIARVVTLVNGNTWNGLSSAGVTGSWDSELSEVSDDSPTFAQPSVPTHTARMFVQASIQATQDIANLEGDLLMLLADGKDRLEGAAHATGSGSGQPTGIFTALTGTAQVIQSDTAAALALADLDEVYTTLGQRWRGRSTWVYNPQVGAAIRALGTAVSASYSGGLSDGYTARINNRPVVESDDAPFVSTTTALDPRLVLGDFSNYVIVDKPGSMVVEYIPHLFNTTTNLPDGRRGWFAYFRSGADSVNDAAFQMLSDKTSA